MIDMQLVRILNAAALIAAASLSIYLGHFRRYKAFLALGTGWLLNLYYLLFLEPAHGSGSTLTRPLGTVVVGSFASMMFLLAGLLMGRDRRPMKTTFIVAGVFTFTMAITVSMFWFGPFRNLQEPRAFAVVSTPSTLLAIIGLGWLGHQLAFRFSRDGAGRGQISDLLLGPPLYVYAILQILYLTRQFSDDPVLASAMGTAFWIAIVCKYAHLVGLIAVVFPRALLQQAAEAPEQEDVRQLTYLLGTIAHEMKAPLQSLRNYGAAAKKYLAEPERDNRGALLELVEGMTAEARRMIEIHDEMRALSEPLSPEHLSSIRVTTILDDAAASYRKSYQVRDITFTTHYSRGLTVLAHAGRLEQVFMNILRNAGESIGDARARGDTGKGRIDLYAEKLWREDHDVCRIMIVDNGAGITEEAGRRLFVPYFTTKRGTNRGLGMYISRQLITSMGGAITLEPQREPGKHGAVVTIYLQMQEGRWVGRDGD